MSAHNPKTPAEWQEAVDAAHVYLLIDSARKYGLVEGGPKINVERCEQILRLGHAKGIRPRPDAVDRWATSQARRAGA